MWFGMFFFTLIWLQNSSLFFFFSDITSWDLNILCQLIQSFPLYLSFKSFSLCLSSKILSFIISNNNLSYISHFKYCIFFTFKSFIPFLSCFSFLHLLPLHSCFSLNFWTINRAHLEVLVYYHLFGSWFCFLVINYSILVLAT